MAGSDAHRDHSRWMESVLADDELTPGACKVAIRLALHKNIKTGQCNPSVATLMNGTKMSRRGVQVALGQLEGRGWITRDGAGRYWLRWGGAPPCAPPCEEPCAGGAHGDAGEAHRGAHPGRTVVRPNTELNTEVNIGGNTIIDASERAPPESCDRLEYWSKFFEDDLPPPDYPGGHHGWRKDRSYVTMAKLKANNAQRRAGRAPAEPPTRERTLAAAWARITRFIPPEQLAELTQDRRIAILGTEHTDDQLAAIADELEREFGAPVQRARAGSG